MRFAIPSETADGLASVRSGHFGHCPYFTVVTFDDAGTVASAESVKNIDHDQYGCGGVIDYVLGLNVDGILTSSSSSTFSRNRPMISSSIVSFSF